MLNDPNSRTLWCLKLRQFLQVDGIHTLPSTPIPEASAPMEPEGVVLLVLIFWLEFFVMFFFLGGVDSWLFCWG